MLQLLAGSGEHAIVVRRTRSEAALLTMSACERAAVLRSWLFLGDVVRLSGQIGRHGLCANHGLTAADHLESCGDVGHEHRKCAQHSCQPKLRKLRGYQPSVRVFVPCHGLDNNPSIGPGRIWEAPSYDLSKQSFEIVGQDFWLSYEFGTGLSPTCGHSRACPENDPVERVVGVAPGFRLTRFARVRNDNGGERS